MAQVAPFTVTFRRLHLDTCLERQTYRGRVLDVGGKKESKRGHFRPPLGTVESWEYLNISQDTNPDFLASADEMPFDSPRFDTVILCEVLEHVSDPVKVLSECSRVLKPGGLIVGSMPFMWSVHADPFDFQRWTAVKVERELKFVGMCDIKVEAMGGLWAVIYDAVKCEHGKKRWVAAVLKAFRPLLLWLTRSGKDRSEKVTTGWFFVATKN